MALAALQRALATRTVPPGLVHHEVYHEKRLHAAADPRPLIEYSNSATVFVLEQLADIDLSQVQPRPLVEFADGGWTLNLSPPAELLQKQK